MPQKYLNWQLVVRKKIIDFKNFGTEQAIKNENLISLFVKGHNDCEIAKICGIMLRQILQKFETAKFFLKTDAFTQLFDCIKAQNFEIIANAFITLKYILVWQNHDSNPDILSFFICHLAELLNHFFDVITGGNTFTRRQSIQILKEFLLIYTHYLVKKKIAIHKEIIKWSIKLLMDFSRGTQYEALLILKIFVVQENKRPEIIALIARNKEILIKYFNLILTYEEKEISSIKLRLTNEIGSVKKQCFCANKFCGTKKESSYFIR